MFEEVCQRDLAGAIWKRLEPKIEAIVTTLVREQMPSVLRGSYMDMQGRLPEEHMVKAITDPICELTGAALSKDILSSAREELSSTSTSKLQQSISSNWFDGIPGASMSSNDYVAFWNDKLPDEMPHQPAGTHASSSGTDCSNRWVVSDTMQQTLPGDEDIFGHLLWDSVMDLPTT